MTEHHCQAREYQDGRVRCPRCRLNTALDNFQGCRASPGPSSSSVFAGAIAVVLAILAATVLVAWMNGAI